MANNPLLGSRISLISKKDIRYEGTLYSINETDATVALQNVRSFGTEGREKRDGAAGTFIPPQATVHPYLLFRGMDIKDLHVHEKASDVAKKEDVPSDPAILSATAPPEVANKQASADSTAAKKKVDSPGNDDVFDKEPDTKPEKRATKTLTKADSTASSSSAKGQREPSQQNNNNSNSRRRPPRKKNEMVGTGASLLNRKVLGTVDGEAPKVGEDFDLESATAKFDKDAEYEQINGENPEPIESSYKKDDFFDEISCDVTDKMNGVHTRLRGAEERKVNTETFGAVSLKYDYNNTEEGIAGMVVVVVDEEEAEGAGVHPREKINDGEELIRMNKIQKNERKQLQAPKSFVLAGVLVAVCSKSLVE
eukprot:CAMPEP_0196801888 /NCGR_PEP_ID=MMETSP1362-20130617/1658_1 /TAXON_ID=163516 /ORGANISM="Leptocylindrus danicus, Strain CCMP1856" /LENGTH=365 /DNA_ID=CAMNT_0042173061 /DNA_START=129 /DNA_END=1230 /DNA_ORIENTATION=+